MVNVYQLVSNIPTLRTVPALIAHVARAPIGRRAHALLAAATAFGMAGALLRLPVVAGRQCGWHRNWWLGALLLRIAFTAKLDDTRFRDVLPDVYFGYDGFRKHGWLLFWDTEDVNDIPTNKRV